MSERLPDHLPPRDRRQGRRLLTLRNAGFVLLALVLLFAALMVSSEVRRNRKGGEFGRLFGKQVTRVEPPPAYHAPEPVKEGEIPDDDRANALLVEPAGRSQILGADPVQQRNAALAANATASSASSSASAAPPKLAGQDAFGVKPENAPLRRGQHITVVGDANGVTVVKAPEPPPIKP